MVKEDNASKYTVTTRILLPIQSNPTDVDDDVLYPMLRNPIMERNAP
jgi:hypothetical protein